MFNRKAHRGRREFSAMLKSELRKIYIARRKSLSPKERAGKSRAIAGQFFQNFDLSAVKFLHCFIAIKRFGEIDTSLIFEKVWRDFPQIETLVPRVNFETGEIESLTFSPETLLAQSSWGISEPVESKIVEAQVIDLVLVPLLCFDERGFRIGYGKGFYDKFLRRCRADVLKIGLSYFPATEEISDTHDFDVKLDFCLTPEKIWKFQ